MNLKKIAAWILLVVLLVTPFINWRLGAVLWLCAWIIYVLQLAINSWQRRQPPPPEN